MRTGKRPVKGNLATAQKIRGRKPKKVTVSLALDSNAVNQIKSMASASKISFNAKVNDILEKYVNFFYMTERDRTAIIPRSLHQFFVNEIDEDKYTVELKRIGVQIIQAMFVQTGLDNNLNNLVKFVFEGLCVNGGSITSVRKYTNEEGKTCLYFTHDYDLKWSRILSAALSNQIEQVLHYHTTTTTFPEGFEIRILDTVLS